MGRVGAWPVGRAKKPDAVLMDAEERAMAGRLLGSLCAALDLAQEAVAETDSWHARRLRFAASGHLQDAARLLEVLSWRATMAEETSAAGLP